MADLVPYPFASLVRRQFAELERSSSIFDLPQRAFFGGDEARDLSVEFHGHRAASPLGPAAGPQTQMAQNIVLSWLGGGRILELKTVQIQDDLEIPRPCIDVRTVGFNAEWSQELQLAESLEEYVKGAMLVEMLRCSAGLRLSPGFDGVVYDMSVGYNLTGIQSPRVLDFIRGMRDASGLVDRLRREIPQSHADLRDLDFPTALSDTLTLSTFHGCPPDEIERIIIFLMEEMGLHCIVKLNPMLLGPKDLRPLLHEELGYEDLVVPDSAFERDTRWTQAVGMVGRLQERARSLDLGFGVKLTNTLIVENRQGFLPPSEREVYLSGAPLHILAMHLVRRFRRTFGSDLPISFSAGIDRLNFPDAVALGLVPVTVCTDLLRPGGYARLAGYSGALVARMEAVGARDLGELVVLGFGHEIEALRQAGARPEEIAAVERGLEGGMPPRDLVGSDLFERWRGAAELLNTETYVARATQDPRYSAERNGRSPRKIGRHLLLFDCVTCDKCIPVCPNDANFHFPTVEERVPKVRLRPKPDGSWEWSANGELVLEQRHQIATFQDFCNECGNCDVFCPEDGGPYVMKPRFFGAAEAWRQQPGLDGFVVTRQGGRDLVLGRFRGREFELEVVASAASFRGSGFDLALDLESPRDSLRGSGEGEVDLTYCFLMDYVRRAVLDQGTVNYVNCLVDEEEV